MDPQAYLDISLTINFSWPCWDWKPWWSCP